MNPYDQKENNPYNKFVYAGYQDLTEKPKEEQGDFARGIGTAFKQLPQLGYGLVAAAGAGAESAFGEGGLSTGLKKWGVKGYEDWASKIQETAKESDDFLNSWEKAKQGDIGSLVDFVQYGLGYAAGQGAQALATAGVGKLGAQLAFKKFGKEYVEGLVENEVGKLAATEAAKDFTEDALRRAAVVNIADKIGRTGATTAIGAQAFGMEGGEIGGELAKQSVAENRALTGEEIAKGFVSTLGAGALEFIGDKIGLDLMLGKSLLLKPAAAMEGVSGRLARGTIAAAGAAPVEAGTEFGQTLIEEYGKGKDAFSDESLRNAINAAALGGVGGGGIGFGSGAIRSARPIELPSIGDQINQEREVQLSKSATELQQAQTVDEAIAAATKFNNVPIHITTAGDVIARQELATSEQKIDQIRNLANTPAMQDFMSSLPADERSQIMDVMNIALSPTAPTRTQAAEELYQVLSDQNLFSAPTPKQTIVELKNEVKKISESPLWKDHVATLSEQDQKEANEIVSNALNPLLPAKYRTTLAETVLEYADKVIPNARIAWSPAVEQAEVAKFKQIPETQRTSFQKQAIESFDKRQIETQKQVNSLEPVLAPTIIPTKIKSNDPREIIANTKFEDAIGTLSYVAPELLPTQGDGLTRQAAESIQKLGKALGKNVHFFNQNNAQVRLDGYANPDHQNDIFVNVGRGDAGWHYVAGHEFFHQLPSDLKRKFIESVTPLIPADKLGKLKDYINQGTLDEGGQWEEIGADLFGNRFGEPDFLSKLLGGVTDTPTLLKMVKAIRDFVDSVLASLKTQGFATDKFVTDLQKVRDSAQAILQEHLNQVKESEKNVSESAKVEQETTQAKTSEDEAKAILDQAGIVGKERLDAIKDVKAGTVSIEELKSAYPPSIQFVREQKRIAAEKERAFAEQERLAQIPKEELDVIAEAGRDVRVQEAENLTKLQGFDENVPTAIEEKMLQAVDNILAIPISKRTSLQKKMLKKFGIEETRKPRPKPIKRKSGIQGLRDSLKRKNPFLAFLAENGINTADRSDVGGQDSKRYFAAGYGAIFRNKGLRLDELAQLAEEQGFLTQAEVANESDNGGVNRLAEMINQAINGEVVTTGEQDFDFQSYYDDQLKNTALEFGIDIRGKSLDRLAELVNMYYASMDEATIAAREAEFELQLQEISNDLLLQLQERSIENLLDENETDNQGIAQNNVEPAATIAPKIDKQRNLKEKNFNRREVERILDIPEEKRSKKDAEFLRRNQSWLSSERGSIELDQQIQEAKQKYGIAPTKKNLDALNALLEQVPAVVEEDYRGQHRAPDSDDGAPLSNVSSNGIYPEDFYSANGLRYYETGHSSDSEAMSIIRSMKDNPKGKVTIYRAVPYEKSNQEKIAELEKQKAYILKTGKIPNGVFTKLSKSEYYDKIYDEIVELKNAPEKTINNQIDSINNGDWVAITRSYAKDHGDGALNGEYKILSKKVRADEIFTNGDSFQEWGYSPKVSRSSERKEIRDLVITHNLTEANLIHADKMGGIAVPSLAVTNKDSALTNFGEITLIGDKKLADPKGYAKTKVFGADIYSPRYPTVEYEISRKAKADAEKRLANSEKATGSNIDWSDIEKYGTRTLEDSPVMIHAYLGSKGIEPNIVYEKAVDPARVEELKAQGLGEYLNVKDRYSLESNREFKKKAVDAKIAYYEDKAKEVPPFKEFADELRKDEYKQIRVVRELAEEISEIARKSNQPLAPNRYETRDSLRKQVSGDQDFKSFVQNFMGDIGATERIFKGYSNSGNRTYQPHTLENVVKILKKELRGGEGFNYGVGSLRAKFTPEFKMIADIRKNKDRLTTADNFKKVKEEIDSDFFAVGESMGVTRTETVMAILEDAPKMGLDRAAKQYGVELGDNAKEKAADFLNKLKNLPTEYFEAKILRDVDLSEFSGAVVPKGISDKALSILKRNGIPVKEYTNDDDRINAIHDFAVQRDQEKGDILFSKQRNNIEPDSELEEIFAGLDKSGLARARAQSKLDALPNAKEIQYVHDNFLDILEKLEDAGVLSINCD